MMSGTLVTVCAWLALACTVMLVVAEPFTIGRPREPRTAGDYVFGLAGGSVTVILCGRVLGWW